MRCRRGEARARNLRTDSSYCEFHEGEARRVGVMLRQSIMRAELAASYMMVQL